MHWEYIENKAEDGRQNIHWNSMLAIQRHTNNWQKIVNKHCGPGRESKHTSENRVKNQKKLKSGYCPWC